MDMMEQVIDPAKIYMKVQLKIVPILKWYKFDQFRMQFVLFEDRRNLIGRNFKKLHLQQVNGLPETSGTDISTSY